jgi:hypothetical protein
MKRTTGHKKLKRENQEDKQSSTHDQCEAAIGVSLFKSVEK